MLMKSFQKSSCKAVGFFRWKRKMYLTRIMASK
jgi:hypothetical protein